MTDGGGRTIFYEGDDPEGFRQQMVQEFGFDPAAPEYRGQYEDGRPLAEVTWGAWIPSERHEGGGFWNYGFWCPPHAYQEVCYSGRWQMGT